MNDGQIRRLVHEAIGEPTIPRDFAIQLERRSSRPTPRRPTWVAGSAATLFALLIVGTLVFARFNATTLPRPSGGSHTYTVAAMVEIRRDGSTDICFPLILSSDPQQPCPNTVPLQIHSAGLPPMKTLVDGTVWTSPLELTGTWTGSALEVKTAPKNAAEVSAVGRPGLGAGNAPGVPTDAYERSQQRLKADLPNLRTRGIWIAESGWSKAGFYIIAVAADKPTLEYLKTTYAADYVTSWFQFVS